MARERTGFYHCYSSDYSQREHADLEPHMSRIAAQHTGSGISFAHAMWLAAAEILQLCDVDYVDWG